MDGKKKLEELVAEVNSWPEWQATRVFAADIRSISDAFKALDAENARLREALTPSAWTKAAYIGEFFETVEMPNPDYDEDNEDEDSSESIAHRVPVSWTTIKKIMAAILVHASALKGASRHEG